MLHMHTRSYIHEGKIEKNSEEIRIATFITPISLGRFDH